MAQERIEVTDGPAAGSEHALGSELVLGRSSEGFGALGGDPEISRRHAQISRTPEGRLYISDLGSTNGTFVNGQRISGSAWLNPGDVVRTGRSTLKVGGGEADPGATAIKPVPGAAATAVPDAAEAQAAPPEPASPAAPAARPEPSAPAEPERRPAPGPSAPPPPVPIPGPSAGPGGPGPAPGPRAPAPGGPAPGGPPPGGPGGGGPPGGGPGGPLPPSGPGGALSPGPAPTGGRRRGLVISLTIAAAVLVLALVAGGLAVAGVFDSDETTPKVDTTPTAPDVPTVPSNPSTSPTTPTTPTQPDENAGRAVYVVQFDRIQGSYSKQVRRLVRRARNPGSVGEIIDAFKDLKGLYGSTATRLNNLEIPDGIRPVHRSYASRLRSASAGVNLVIACARQRNQGCYDRRVKSLAGRTRKIRKQFTKSFRSRDYPVVIAAPS